ncbi:MAG: sigma-70 family RNA polymerase sigma factor [Phycisphaerales bacterium]|nr:sigma-70 family RNA polymerase sigma factor [Phycisphaerales bacterium]
MRAAPQQHFGSPGADREAPAPGDPAPGHGLVARAVGGDTLAFADLYREHGPTVHAVLLARVPRADADDLTQEVFVAAWRRLGELRDPDALGAWLMAIARRRAIDWARERARRLARERAQFSNGDPLHPGEHARADAVLAKIRALPEVYREALLMRLVAGMTGRQIAARLGMTEGSVRVHLHRGMGLLRETMAEESR